jgi:hypothetical protein
MCFLKKDTFQTTGKLQMTFSPLSILAVQLIDAGRERKGCSLWGKKKPLQDYKGVIAQVSLTLMLIQKVSHA